jgi:Zn-finger nucleic acid-binding protein
MKCPIDSTDLQMTERQGIEIDYCPTCRGIWLDRGELDKLIERSASFGGRTEPPAEPARERPPAPRDPRDRPRVDDDDYDRDYRRPRRRSFLDDLFDFD